MLRSLLQSRPSPTVVELVLGAFVARILVHADVVVAASAGPFSGRDLLLRVLLVPDRAFRDRPLQGALPPAQLGGVDALLADIDREIAELQKKAERVGGFHRVWTVRFAGLKAVMGELPDDVKRVVRLVDGSRPIAALLAESPLAPALTLRVAERLLALGVLERGDLVDVAAGPVVVDAAPAAGRGPDRSWLEQRTSLLPQPAEPSTPSTTPEPPSSTPEPSSSSTPSTTPSTTPAAPVTSEPPLLLSTPKPPRPRAEPTVAGTSSLPTPLPLPKPELRAWLGSEDDFFEAHAPTQSSSTSTSWPPWVLVAMVLAGAAVGALLARSCVG